MAIVDGESHGGLGVTELRDRTVEREMRGMLEQVQNARSADRLREAEGPIHSERELLH